MLNFFPRPFLHSFCWVSDTRSRLVCFRHRQSWCGSCGLCEPGQVWYATLFSSDFAHVYALPIQSFPLSFWRFVRFFARFGWQMILHSSLCVSDRTWRQLCQFGVDMNWLLHSEKLSRFYLGSCTTLVYCKQIRPLYPYECYPWLRKRRCFHVLYFANHLQRCSSNLFHCFCKMHYYHRPLLSPQMQILVWDFIHQRSI